MGKFNWGRVLIGGLVAGVVMNLLSFAGWALLVTAIVFAMSACNSELGVVGGLDASSGTQNFAGIKTATVLSPSSVRLSWDTDANHSKYELYSSISAVPLGSTLFSSLTASGLNPDTEYVFAVAGLRKTGGTDGLSTTLKVRTWPKFSGITALAATTATTLQATWAYAAQGPTFSVYVAEGAKPTDFSKPAVTTNTTAAAIVQLANGMPIKADTVYYVIVRATYLDQTTEFNSNTLHVKTPSKKDRKDELPLRLPGF